ncbi:MAG: hypothetical protein U0325_35625 [Polyangiales bacterium]
MMVRPGAMRGLYAMGIRWGFGRGAVRDLVDALSVEHALSPEQVRALRVPVRVLWGAEERVLPPRGGASSKTTSLPTAAPRHLGLGHCPHLDDCDRVAGMITGWCHEFAQVPPA